MENKSLKQIIDNRLEKLKKIRELGIEPYAYDYDSSHPVSYTHLTLPTKA